MKLFGTSVGIEMAGKDLRLAVVRSVAGRLRLVATLESPGFLDLSPEERKAALTKLIAQHRLPASRVFLSVPHHRGVVRQLEFPVEVFDRLRQAIELQIESLSPWSADEVYWDVSHEAPAKSARTFRATVAILSREFLDPWLDFFKSAGLPLSGASLSSLCHAHGVQMLWPTSGPAMVLDCEEDNVEGSLLNDGRIFAVTQPAGDTTAVMQSVAERLSSAGRVPSLDNVRLLICGPGADALEGREFPALPIEGARPQSSGRFGAVAASLAGLGKTAFAVNLVPKAMRHRRNQAQWIPTYALLAAALLLGAAFLLREPYQMMAYAADIDEEIRRIAPSAGDVVEQQSELNDLTEKYRALSAVLQGRDHALDAMRELTRILPASAWLLSYSYQDSVVTISGVADSASEVLTAIEASPLFQEVQFTGSVTKNARNKDRFTLRAAIEVPR